MSALMTRTLLDQQPVSVRRETFAQSATRRPRDKMQINDSEDGTDDNIEGTDDNIEGTDDNIDRTDDNTDEDRQLYSISLTPQEVLDFVARLRPALSPSSPEIALLIASVRAQVKSAPPLHVPAIHTSPTTWQTTNEAMDSLWLEAVEGELTVPPPEIATIGLDMRPDYLVKPMGSLEDPLMVLGSYPTAAPKSSLHLSYGTINDMSNESISRLLIKLGFHVVNVRTTGVFMVDVFPRRLDRKAIPGLSERVLDNVPRRLRHFWQTFAYICLDRSTAHVLLLIGSKAYADYAQYLRERQRPHKMTFLTDGNRPRNERPAAVLEYHDDDETTIRRIAIVSFHPEAYARQKSVTPSDTQRTHAIRERLLDYASAIMYNQVDMQGFFTSCNYIFNMSSGTLLPTQAVIEGNEALAKHLHLPITCPNVFLAINSLMKRLGRKLSPNTIAIIRGCEMDIEEALAWLRRPELAAMYGPYIETYRAFIVQTGTRSEAHKQKTRQLGSREKKRLIQELETSLLEEFGDPHGRRQTIFEQDQRRRLHTQLF